MKQFLIAICIMAFTCPVFSQELYINTEPASNMATHSLGIRLENQGYFSPGYKNRTTLEMMYGASRNIMVHGSLYRSNYYQNDQRFEGGSVYLKYRFLSIDSVQKHFRGAFFVKAASINNPLLNQEISLEGENTGVQGGVIFTKLMHKLAVSGSASYLHAFDNKGGYKLPVTNSNSAVSYSLSAGYLLLPKVYQNYNQVNLNLYAEILGKTNPGYGQSYLDAAPGVQLIFNSLVRVDFSYHAPLYNHMLRTSNNTYLIRVEYNLFNIF
jgi:hypothetical protein